MMPGLLLILTPTLPALMAAVAMVPRFKPTILRTAWIAAVPALATAVLVPEGTGVFLDNVLFGLGLALTDTGRIVLGFSAFLWLLAGVHASGYLAPASPRPRFMGLFLLVMAGNFGLLIAQDLAGFYAYFALMSLASYVLVVHDQTQKAFQAGAVYIVLAVIGETALLIGMMLAAVLADSLDISLIRLTLADGDPPITVIVLLAVGFGIKMGLLPLHFWLPLAHPAAPAPASAVLSGAMIKAGLFGLITFLPFGLVQWPHGGGILVIIGLTTAFYGVVCGLAQDDSKAILAYSSLSQMGVLATGLGVGWLAPQIWPALIGALGLYMLHHGLTKGGLFLLVGAHQKGAFTDANRVPLAVVTVVGALALAGLPLTSGAVAKLALKDSLEIASTALVDILVFTLSLSAVATTLLVCRFLWIFAPWRQPGPGETASPAAGSAMVASGVVAIITGQAATWGLTPQSAASLTVSGYGLWQSGWPVGFALVMVAVAVIAAKRGYPRHVPHMPPGDFLWLILPAGRWLLNRSLWAGRHGAVATNRLASGIERSVLTVLRGSERRERLWEQAAERGYGKQTLMAIAILLLAITLVGVLAGV